MSEFSERTERTQTGIEHARSWNPAVDRLALVVADPSTLTPDELARRDQIVATDKARNAWAANDGGQSAEAPAPCIVCGTELARASGPTLPIRRVPLPSAEPS